MPVRAVLFDAAGTLIHLSEPVGVVYGRFAQRGGVSVSSDAIERAFRSTFPSMPAMVFPGVAAADVAAYEHEWWRELVQRVFATAAPTSRFTDFDAFFDELFTHFARPSAWSAADGALDTLRALRARSLRTGVISNFDHRLPALLDGLGLSPLLDVVIRPSDAGAAKPDARIFQAALDRLGIAASDALYVGDDDEEDVRGAEAAGLRAINVGTLPRLGALLDYVAAQ